MSNFLKTQRFVNVEPKHFSKKAVYIENEKNESSRNEKKAMTSLERHKNVSCRMKVTPTIKTKKKVIKKPRARL